MTYTQRPCISHPPLRQTLPIAQAAVPHRAHTLRGNVVSHEGSDAGAGAGAGAGAATERADDVISRMHWAAQGASSECHAAVGAPSRTPTVTCSSPPKPAPRTRARTRTAVVCKFSRRTDALSRVVAAMTVGAAVEGAAHHAKSGANAEAAALRPANTSHARAARSYAVCRTNPDASACIHLQW
jgi:hypothetical protein